MHDFLGYYFLVGLIYTVINGTLRSMDEYDPLLVLVWITLWPIGMLSLLARAVQYTYTKWFKNKS